MLFDLSPAKVALFHFFFVILNPPESVFEKRTDHDRIVTFADEILVNDVGRRIYQVITGHVRG